MVINDGPDYFPFINPAPFVPSPVGTLGNEGHDDLVGPRLVQVDETLSHFFPIGEQRK
jgi:hypothetical protein